MAPQVGLEPTTLRLTAECSTIELLRTKVNEFLPFNQTDGASVKRGTMLFTIDPRPYQAAVHVAEANVAESQAALDLAKIENLL